MIFPICRGYIGVPIGIMEKKMEFNILGFYWENGKENGIFYSVLGLLG